MCLYVMKALSGTVCARLLQVWSLALSGSVCISLAMQIAGLLTASLLHILPQQSCFVAACLTLSSTPLAQRFFKGPTLRQSFYGLRGRTDSDLRAAAPAKDARTLGKGLPCGPQCMYLGSAGDVSSSSTGEQEKKQNWLFLEGVHLEHLFFLFSFP